MSSPSRHLSPPRPLSLTHTRTHADGDGDGHVLFSHVLLVMMGSSTEQPCPLPCQRFDLGNMTEADKTLKGGAAGGRQAGRPSRCTGWTCTLPASSSSPRPKRSSPCFMRSFGQCPPWVLPSCPPPTPSGALPCPGGAPSIPSVTQNVTARKAEGNAPRAMLCQKCRAMLGQERRHSSPSGASLPSSVPPSLPPSFSTSLLPASNLLRVLPLFPSFLV